MKASGKGPFFFRDAVTGSLLMAMQATLIGLSRLYSKKEDMNVEESCIKGP